MDQLLDMEAKYKDLISEDGKNTDSSDTEDALVIDAGTSKPDGCDSDETESCDSMEKCNGDVEKTREAKGTNMETLKKYINFYKVTKVFEQKIASLKLRDQRKQSLSMSYLSEVKEAMHTPSNKAVSMMVVLKKWKSESNLNKHDSGVNLEFLRHSDDEASTSLEQTEFINQDSLAVASNENEMNVIEQDPLSMHDDEPRNSSIFLEASPKKGGIRIRKFTELIEEKPIPKVISKKLNIPVKFDLRSMKVIGQSNLQNLNKPPLTDNVGTNSVEEEFNPRIEAAFSLAESWDLSPVKPSSPNKKLHSTQHAISVNSKPSGENKEITSGTEKFVTNKAALPVQPEENEKIVTKCKDISILRKECLNKNGINNSQLNQESKQNVEMPAKRRLVQVTEDGKIRLYIPSQSNAVPQTNPGVSTDLLPIVKSASKESSPSVIFLPNNQENCLAKTVNAKGSSLVLVDAYTSKGRSQVIHKSTPINSGMKSTPQTLNVLSAPLSPSPPKIRYSFVGDRVVANIQPLRNNTQLAKKTTTIRPQNIAKNLVRPQNAANIPIIPQIAANNPMRLQNAANITNRPQFTANATIKHENAANTPIRPHNAANIQIRPQNAFNIQPSKKNFQPAKNPMATISPDMKNINGGNETIIGNMKLVRPISPKTLISSEISFKILEDDKNSLLSEPSINSRKFNATTFKSSDKSILAPFTKTVLGSTNKTEKLDSSTKNPNFLPPFIQKSKISSANTSTSSLISTSPSTLSPKSARSSVTKKYPPHFYHFNDLIPANNKSSAVPSISTIAKSQLLFRKDIPKKPAFVLALGIQKKSDVGPLRKYVCPWCKARYVKKYLLKQHTHRITCNMVYECFGCGGKRLLFRNRCQLLAHLRGHCGSGKLVLNYGKLKVFRISVNDLFGAPVDESDFNSDDETVAAHKRLFHGSLLTKKTTVKRNSPSTQPIVQHADNILRAFLEKSVTNATSSTMSGEKATSLTNSEANTTASTNSESKATSSTIFGTSSTLLTNFEAKPKVSSANENSALKNFEKEASSLTAGIKTNSKSNEDPNQTSSKGLMKNLKEETNVQDEKNILSEEIKNKNEKAINSTQAKKDSPKSKTNDSSGANKRGKQSIVNENYLRDARNSASQVTKVLKRPFVWGEKSETGGESSVGVDGKKRKTTRCNSTSDIAVSCLDIKKSTNDLQSCRRKSEADTNVKETEETISKPSDFTPVDCIDMEQIAESTSTISDSKSTKKMIDTGVVNESEKVQMNGNIESCDKETEEIKLQSKQVKICPFCQKKPKRSCFNCNHRPSRAFVCTTYCQALLANACTLSAHNNLHERRPPFICPTCGCEFEMYKKLSKHLTVTCRPRVTLIQCSLPCSKKGTKLDRCEFTSEYLPQFQKDNEHWSSFQKHVEEVHLEKRDDQFFCKVCKFMNRGIWNGELVGDPCVHFSTHMRPLKLRYGFKCEPCGETFLSRTVLSQHTCRTQQMGSNEIES